MPPSAEGLVQQFDPCLNVDIVLYDGSQRLSLDNRLSEVEVLLIVVALAKHPAPKPLPANSSEGVL
jgi:hypothetical protein